MRLAIFDVDGTLIAGKSTEKRFIAWLMQHGYLSPRQLAAMVWHVPRRLPVYGRHVFRKNKAYLAGLSQQTVEEQATQFVDALPETEWIDATMQELRKHRERGETVLLLSGTLQPIIDALAVRVGADSAIGTICDCRSGRFTGKPPSRHPFYHAKAELLAEICERHDAEAADVVAYADSRFDIPLLARVGAPVAVGPDRALAKWAGEHRCRIIEYRSSQLKDPSGAT
jgi:HAD superfamily hydrolase (TIGR01490 family)